MLCPPTERRWLDAMSAEAAVVETDERPRWAAGALGVVWTAIALRARAVVPSPLWWAMLAALHAVVAFAIGSRTDIEAAGLDDDVFLRLAWVAGALLIGLGSLAINRIFSNTDTLPHGR